LYNAYQNIYKEEKLRAGDITQEEFDNNDPKLLKGLMSTLKRKLLLRLSVTGNHRQVSLETLVSG
jgi:hypothetical protein